MRKIVLLVALFGFVHTAAAQNADDYRGGWKTDGDTSVSADPHTYDFSIRGTVVRGIYCTHCSDATTLAFVNGTLGADGLAFVVTHVKDDGSTAYQDHATAKVENGQLMVTGTSGRPGGGPFTWTMRKDSRGPAPLPVPVTRLRGAPVPAAPPPGAGRGFRPQYIQPGPWEPLTPAKVVGVWLGFGSGIIKQFFIIRRVGTGLRGMVCGPCDNPYTMAALDDFRIDGDTLRFNILHEDWGPGTLPFHNQVTAHVSANELRIVTQQDNRPPRPNRGGGGAANGGASLMGPVAIEATAGNP
jgi:hypothetical protein